MPENSKILFIINEGAGSGSVNWEKDIRNYFEAGSHETEFLKLGKKTDKKILQQEIEKSGANRVVAVGGDGTFALVATILEGSKIPIGIIPGGSANGMATDLGIPASLSKALDVITGDHLFDMDAVKVNDRLSFHLADIGLNARMIKYFDESRFRGMWNYARMLVKALINHKLVTVSIKSDEKEKLFSAYMVVFANASKYGTGAVINPDSSVTDGVFEIVVVRKIAFRELITLFWKHKKFNPKSVETIKTKSVVVTSKKRVHFQVDGQYLGKTRKVTAEIVPAAIKVIVPSTKTRN